MAEQVEPIVVVVASPGGHVQGLKAACYLFATSALFGSKDRHRQQEHQEDDDKGGYGRD
jgi:hypothetical protein